MGLKQTGLSFVVLKVTGLNILALTIWGKKLNRKYLKIPFQLFRKHIYFLFTEMHQSIGLLLEKYFLIIVIIMGIVNTFGG